MNQPLRREISMDHTGYLGNARVVHNNHYDAATQADIHHVALTYESEDEAMGRLHSRSRRGTALYSKQDIREQYCISDRGLGALETDRQSLFGCLSSHQNSPCSTRTSLLTVCVRQKIPSDENLQDLYRRHPADYAPYPRRVRYPWDPPPPEIFRYDKELSSSYLRRTHMDPNKYTWMPSDDESVRMERPRSVLEPCPAHIIIPPPPPPAARPKHVSFARSHTLASFDDAAVSLSTSSTPIRRMTRSQERLLDVRKPDALPITRQPELSDNMLVMEKLKRGPMKTQATQTEASLGRKYIPSSQLNLSPRTIHRVKMVSQGAQTNGMQQNGRKLMKSLSEVGTTFGFKEDIANGELIPEHEPLLRTQSDEPPRSPFIVTSPPLPLPSDSSSITHDSEESETKKEIFIDFKPLIPSSQGNSSKKPLIKTVSDGEILLDHKKIFRGDIKVPSKHITSMSHENITIEEEPVRAFEPYFKNTPIRNEGIFKTLEGSVYSSMSESFEGSFVPQDSIEEEFHENIIYSGIYLSPGGTTEFRAITDDLPEQSIENYSPEDESVVPSFCLADRKLSPFASNDSLANDIRDHSDGIWNESQATVLQVDSGTDNGTALSSSEVASVASPSSTNLLTPSSRRKHLLLLQHQQRSSMDTEALEEELAEQSFTPISPRITIETVSKEVVPKQQYLTPHSAISPIRRRKTPEPQAESPLPAVVPDLILSRTDSGKTNTDISESTTTDDYITATSGTDSSRKSGSTKGVSEKHHQDGSSFESASSLYSVAKDVLGDDMVVPTFSPPPIPEEASSMASTPVPEAGRSTPSDISSSSGSYSVDGSCPELPHKPIVPSPKKAPSLSEDERSGYYESPQEEDLTWTKSKEVRKRPYTLDINTYRGNEEDKKSAQRSKDQNRLSPLKDTKNEKQKRSKARTRSPMQGHRKNQTLKRGSPLVRSPAVSDHYSGDNWEKSEEKITSDESSCDRPLSSQVSPRKTKKNRDNMRRKSTPRSPTSTKGRRRSGSDDKPSSLPGSLPRRRSSTQMKTLDPDMSQKYPSSGRLSPYSPTGSPTKRHWSPKTSPPDSSKLKALSAESLRSVSPGSDSVFYSDPSSHAAAGDHQVHCLHCGKEVDIVTTDDKSLSSNGNQPDIVQPPAGFADSPRSKPSGRLYKKFDKRFRSEDRTHERRHHRHKSDARAKSEERGSNSETARTKLRPMARSTDASLEGLKATDSSPSVLPGAPEDEDDLGLYNVPYTEGCWIYIDENEEMQAWKKSDSDLARRDSISSIESTESEQEFRKKYQAVTHRMVHRKSCLEMYKRQLSKSFVPESTTGEHESLRERLEEILKLMLVLWCRENQAVKVLSSDQCNESDKTVVVRRESGEFGFRIHGSKPVVVSAIEPDTPAETSGLEVGDIVLAVNGVNVLDKSHSEVVKIAHAGSDTLTLEVARTCGVLSPTSADIHGGSAICSGYLWKLGGTASGAPSTKWIRRWFALKKDNCFYYYKTDSDKQPVGAMMLINYKVTEVTTGGPGPTNSFKFRIENKSIPVLQLAADTEEAAVRWTDVIAHAIEESQMADALLEQTRRNLTLPPNAIQKPDCFGYLVKLGTQWKAWSRRYCVLKDACLYFYHDVNAKNAFGVACLQGYRVQQTVSGSKKHAFEILPADPNQKYYYFHTETEMDRKRWLAALEYSIDRWLKVG